MRESAKWALGIGIFLACIILLWYAVFSLTGMLWWNSEVTPAQSLASPRAPKVAVPDLSSLDIDEALRELRESQKTKPVPIHQMKGLAQLSDDPRLKAVKCECGCGIVLANCDCAVALKQMEELGIIKGETK
ncbi:MAG: hypothetical protein ACE5K3_11570 [bacterium]